MNNNFSLINYNIRSFHSNGAQFECLLQSLNPSNPLIVLTETWNNKDNVSLCKLDGFTDFHTFRSESRGGGVSIFCKENIDSKKIPFLCRNFEFIESCVVKLLLNGQSAFIVGLYRPPNGNINEFLTELEDILRSLPSNNDDIIILAGDLNIDLTNINSNCTSNLMSLLSSMFLYPVITKPTRLGNSSSTLDQIWFNKYFPIFSGIIYLDITDHCPCFLNFELPNLQTIEQNFTIESRPFNESNLNLLINKLENTNWNDLMNFNDINSCFDSFFKFLNVQYCKFFPKNTKIISPKRWKNPWITSELKRKINQKSYFFKLFRRGLISREMNNIIKNRINKEIKVAKDTYYKNILKFHKNDLKKSWNVIKKLSGKIERKEEIVKLLDGDTLITDKTDIANSFVNFFSKIAQNLDDDLPNSSISPYINISRNPNTFFVFPVTEYECQSIVSSLKCVKNDLNKMPVYLFKIVFPYIASIFRKLINESFKLGIFPDVLKCARITPIFKKGDKLLATNFRPISS